MAQFISYNRNQLYQPTPGPFYIGGPYTITHIWIPIEYGLGVHFLWGSYSMAHRIRSMEPHYDMNPGPIYMGSVLYITITHI